ncbi:MAG: SagB/ThcOx family dehydrogenase [Dehalococcoidaceae bacterium]|nr:SagB/ThcOx family dehydrogenase [Dehalococcoidaceae bacterium]
MIQLPRPGHEGQTAVEKVIESRRSVRAYRDDTLDVSDVSGLLWAAQGVSSPEGLRTVPSAGSTYPLEAYLVAGRVSGLEAGIYHYHPEVHNISLIKTGDFRWELCQLAMGQSWVEEAPASLVIAAQYERTTAVYGERGIRYVHMEAGHAAQNVCLQAEAAGYGTVVIGAFRDVQVAELLGLKKGEVPLYIITAGLKY